MAKTVICKKYDINDKTGKSFLAHSVGKDVISPITEKKIKKGTPICYGFPVETFENFPDKIKAQFEVVKTIEAGETDKNEPEVKVIEPEK